MSITARLKEAKDITQALEEDRSQEDDRFREVSEYILPHRGRFIEESPTGGNSAIRDRGKKNVNPAATLAVERAGGGFAVGMTPEGQPWFTLTTPDDRQMETGGVREYLGFCERQINIMLQAGSFYQSIHTCDIELTGFGNMLLFQDFNNITISRFECCTMGTWCVTLDGEGNLDTVTRRLRRSPVQLKKTFGVDRLCKKTRELLITAPFKKNDIIHIVRPREDVKYGYKDKLNMPWQSLIFEDGITEDDPYGDVLHEGGYMENPYHFAPYTETGHSDYGMGPGDLIVNHQKQLSETERQKLIALQKLINPPTLKPSGMKGRLNVAPGGENEYTSDEKALRALYQIPYQAYQYALQEVQDIALRIAAVAKADLFYDLPQELRPKDMTLGEYMERKRERLQQIAPVISIYEPRVLDKVIARCYGLLDRHGLLPPLPPSLQQTGQIQVKYTSVVAKALRQAGAEATRALILDVGQMAKMQAEAGMRPTALMKIDIGQAVDEIAAGTGAPARIIIDDDKFEASVKAADEADRQRAEMEQQQQAVDAAAKLGAVPAEGNLASKALEGQDVGI